MYKKITNYKKIKLENYEQYRKYEKDENILTEELYIEISKENTIFIIISKKNVLLGFFTIKEDSFKLNRKENECIKIDYIYIFEKYRNQMLATSILKDVQELIKEFRQTIDYLLVDTPIIYSMFYLDRGFKFYRAKKGMHHNQVTLFKEV